MLFLEVCGAISKAIRDEQEAKKFDERTSSKKNMSDRVKAVMDWLSQNRSQLFPAWQERERAALVNKIADLIRDRRNEAASTGSASYPITRGDVCADLPLSGLLHQIV